MSKQSTGEQVYEVMYKDLKEGYAVLQGEYERLNVHHKETVAEMEDSISELSVAYYNAQKEISILKNKRLRESKKEYDDNLADSHIEALNLRIKNKRFREEVNKFLMDLINVSNEEKRYISFDTNSYSLGHVDGLEYAIDGLESVLEESE